jgi:hypothetical protein
MDRALDFGSSGTTRDTPHRWVQKGNIKQEAPYIAIPKAPRTAPVLHLETERNTEGPEGPSFFEIKPMIQQE